MYDSMKNVIETTNETMNEYDELNKENIKNHIMSIPLKNSYQIHEKKL